MKILGIETSCDETAASVVEVSADKTSVSLLSSVTATSLHLHAKTGGIIPEVAARSQMKEIIPVICAALQQAQVLQGSDSPAIDALAITYGPGLIGSLLVGVETAKTLSFVWEKPLIPVNHLFGHIYANWLGQNSAEQHKELPKFPAIGLIISGGHTDIIYMKNHEHVEWLGGTRDDAAGEAFDKIGRLLDIPYPAGPTIERLAQQGDPKAYQFPRPLMYDKALDFSFSGLKTAVLRAVEKLENRNGQIIADIARGTQDAIAEVIVYKTLQAAEQYDVSSIVVGGGVAANKTITERLRQEAQKKMPEVTVFVPERVLCTDNAAMIATAAAFQHTQKSWREVTANPELYFD